MSIAIPRLISFQLMIGLEKEENKPWFRKGADKTLAGAWEDLCTKPSANITPEISDQMFKQVEDLYECMKEERELSKKKKQGKCK